MNTRHFFHGTSYSRYMAIKANGFGDFKTTIWDCSDDSRTYMYDMKKFIESEDMEAEEKEYQINHTLHRANESAQITAAFDRNPSEKTVVFEFMVEEDSEFFDYIEEDCSCPNMAKIGAVTIPDKKLNELIFNRKIKTKVHFFNYMPKLALAYIAGLYDSDYLDEKREMMKDAEREAWRLISRCDLSNLYEELFECEEACDPEDFN